MKDCCSGFSRLLEGIQIATQRRMGYKYTQKLEVYIYKPGNTVKCCHCQRPAGREEGWLLRTSTEPLTFDSDDTISDSQPADWISSSVHSSQFFLSSNHTNLL